MIIYYIGKGGCVILQYKASVLVPKGSFPNKKHNNVRQLSTMKVYGHIHTIHDVMVTCDTVTHTHLPTCIHLHVPTLTFHVYIYSHSNTMLTVAPYVCIHCHSHTHLSSLTPSHIHLLSLTHSHTYT